MALFHGGLHTAYHVFLVQERARIGLEQRQAPSPVMGILFETALCICLTAGSRVASTSFNSIYTVPARASSLCPLKALGHTRNHEGRCRFKEGLARRKVRLVGPQNLLNV